jgi:hypothetical protein
MDDSTMPQKILTKATAMLQSLKRKIFGVPPHDTTEAGRVATHLQRQAEHPPRYLPESRLSEQQIHGVGDDGSTWEPWRIDPITAEQWYVRTSMCGAEPSPAIVGIAPSDDLSGDADDDTAFDADVEVVDATEATLQAFRRECGIIKSRYECGEIDDAPDADEFGDADDDA